MALIKLKRGNKSNLPSDANLGEPLYATDSKELYIGNGAGNNLTRVYVYSQDSYVKRSVKIDFSTSSQSSSYTVPDGAIVEDLNLKIKTAFSAGTTISVTVDGGTPIELLGSQDNDPETIGVYYSKLIEEIASANVGVITVNISGSPSAGEGFVLVNILEN